MLSLKIKTTIDKCFQVFNKVLNVLVLDSSWWLKRILQPVHVMFTLEYPSNTISLAVCVCVEFRHVSP